MQYCVEGKTKEFELIPEPCAIDIHPNATVVLPYVGRIVENAGKADIANVWANQIADDIEAATGLRWDIAKGDRWQSFITLSIDSDDVLGQDEYRLTIAQDGITVVGGDAVSLRDGIQTLRQIIRQCAPVLPELTIADKPAYQTRGYYLDATRGRVPTLDWLKRWADKLCLYKYNQLQLYVEHTFAFDNMSETWRGTSPLKPADIIAFDEYCAARGIELVPSVSTFGHLYMALRTRELRHLGEFPEQADRPYSLIERMEHHTLNITEADAFALSCTLIDDYLQLFRSRKFNICGDETFDLGKGRSKPEADKRGVAAMYADYVSRLCEHLSEQGREPLFWGDIAIEMPEILQRLPKDVTLLNWLYEPDITDEKVRLVAESGATQYVCPAVWCWNALLPRLDWAWGNISRLAQYGQRYRAAGFLVTDWGDFGHVNDPRMAIPGMMYGAQCAWDPQWAARVGDDAHAELDCRISMVEYGDSTGEFVAMLRDASHRVTFDWMNIVRYLELDYGDGSLNIDVRNSIRTDAHDGASGVNHAELIHSSETVSEARMNLLAWLKPDILRWAEANKALRADIARLGAIAAQMTTHDVDTVRGSVLQPVLIAAEGQCLFNELGLCLALRDGVITEAEATSDSMPQRVARGLEQWVETYAAVWRTVSAESELRRIADVVWRCADLLRE
ncbi:N-acetyl-beta-hexosaminidase [Bifidobacterium saguini DSM 23967]|uniref:beta-N-acetylhexosaminidase n=2 Tax=Bifidobacterium saguini TaxID=762210 RepID=A0A087D871_9BIFI|nr:glycoside hydrolase family 20 zincin-like fold domain-containing protein [Bifidobacterium saguini]KFI91721.1 N-acetyl-beta-hexosaminidase [Bifidobacterium saguini DSM 23967]QTB89938.1 family 20 glycosylhydrolase [Bifidobacterium saguini]